MVHDKERRKWLANNSYLNINMKFSKSIFIISSLGFCSRNQKKGCFSIMFKRTLKPHKIRISRFNHGQQFIYCKSQMNIGSQETNWEEKKIKLRIPLQFQPNKKVHNITFSRPTSISEKITKLSQQVHIRTSAQKQAVKYHSSAKSSTKTRLQ